MEKTETLCGFTKEESEMFRKRKFPVPRLKSVRGLGCRAEEEEGKIQILLEDSPKIRTRQAKCG
jgi:hypothetical protein